MNMEAINQDLNKQLKSLRETLDSNIRKIEEKTKPTVDSIQQKMRKARPEWLDTDFSKQWNDIRERTTTTVEERYHAFLEQLGLASKEDVEALRKKITTLQRKVTTLSKSINN